MRLLRLTWISLQWDVSFVQGAHDWEVNVLTSFYTLLYSIRVRREGEDKLWWAPSRKGEFDVRSFYRVLVCIDDVHFPWKSIWRTNAPLKVVFYFFIFYFFSMVDAFREDSYHGQS
jgi:hypothetical protein